MTNKELLTEFEKIQKIDNLLDKIEKLKEFNKTYKKSRFFKLTKCPLNKLQQLYIVNAAQKVITNIKEWTDKDTLAFKINDVLDGIDETAIENLFNKLSEQIDIKSLKDLQKEFSKEIEKIKP